MEKRTDAELKKLHGEGYNRVVGAAAAATLVLRPGDVAPLRYINAIQEL